MSDLRQYLIDEFVEDYAAGRLTRREALRRLAGLTGSAAAASALLAACTPPAQQAPAKPAAASPQPAPTAAAQPKPTAAAPAKPAAPAGVTVPPDDPAIEVASVQFPGEGSATLQGYVARPKGSGPFPIVLVCHENRGLTEHIRDVARRLAKAGYAALAIDLLAREGGTDKIADAAQIPGMLGNAPPARFVQDFQAGLRYMQAQPDAAKDRVGMVGFCFGGGVTWRVATKMPELRAAVPFYGPNPPLEDVPGIRAAVLAIYAERDQRINQGIPAIEAAMKQHGKTFEKIIYPNADHAFHNDTNAERYAPEAARDAWAKTLAWFEKHLKS